MFFLRRGLTWLGTMAIGLFCIATHPVLRAWQANAEQEARNQIGKFAHNEIQSAMPGRYQTMADMKRALLTADAIFAAYCRTPLLSPPRGFDVLHNAHADARNTPRGWPIPAGSGFILLAYDSKQPLPKGGFAREGEGPVLGGFQMNTIDCDSREAEKDLGADDKGPFYYMPKQTGTVHGWPQMGGVVFMTKRAQPRWLPVSVERVLNVQIARARQTLQDVNASAPQNTYTQWLNGKARRLQDYQKAHDDMVKAVGKQQADAYLATMIETEKKTESMFAAMAQPGSDIGKMVSGNQAQLGNTLHDLETRLSALSPAERQAPAFVYQNGDGAFAVGQVVPPGTPGSVAVVYPNPDFYDRSLPPWEAQSLCVSVSTGPRSQDHFLYPTIVRIWNSVDWDAIAQVLK